MVCTASPNPSMAQWILRRQQTTYSVIIPFWSPEVWVRFSSNHSLLHSRQAFFQHHLFIFYGMPLVACNTHLLQSHFNTDLIAFLLNCGEFHTVNSNNGCLCALFDFFFWKDVRAGSLYQSCLRNYSWPSCIPARFSSHFSGQNELIQHVVKNKWSTAWLLAYRGQRYWIYNWISVRIAKEMFGKLFLSET